MSDIGVRQFNESLLSSCILLGALTGNYHWWNPFGGDVSFDLGSQDLLKALGCMVLAGPFLTGFTQVRSIHIGHRSISNLNDFVVLCGVLESYRPKMVAHIRRDDSMFQSIAVSNIRWRKAWNGATQSPQIAMCIRSNIATHKTRDRRQYCPEKIAYTCDRS